MIRYLAEEEEQPASRETSPRTVLYYSAAAIIGIPLKNNLISPFIDKCYQARNLNLNFPTISVLLDKTR
jgi:hypothetical protein